VQSSWCSSSLRRATAASRIGEPAWRVSEQPVSCHVRAAILGRLRSILLRTHADCARERLMQILAFVEGDWPDEHSVVPDHRAFLLKYGTLGELREPGSKSPRPPFDSAVVNTGSGPPAKNR
jgi:hypothetical protein